MAVFQIVATIVLSRYVTQTRQIAGGFALMGTSLMSLLLFRSTALVLVIIGLFALGMAFITPNVCAAISTRGEPYTGTALGIQNAANSLGQVAGPLLGGDLVELELQCALPLCRRTAFMDWGTGCLQADDGAALRRQGAERELTKFSSPSLVVDVGYPRDPSFPDVPQYVPRCLISHSSLVCLLRRKALDRLNLPTYRTTSIGKPRALTVAGMRRQGSSKTGM
jgi:hypothetical protein